MHLYKSNELKAFAVETQGDNAANTKKPQLSCGLNKPTQSPAFKCG